MTDVEAGYGMDKKKDEETVKGAVPKPSSNETHDEFMARCIKMGNSESVCMMAHKGHKFKDSDEKEAGYGMKKKIAERPDYLDFDKDGNRKESMKKALQDKKKARASYEYVTMETEVSEAVAIIMANGETVIKISGVAFHEGTNKNRWQITRAGADEVVKQMIGADLTLNHPPTKQKGVGFTRNMNGDVNDAVVGIVTEAKVVDLEGGQYEVHYVAEVRRKELFPALESGLWTRGAYGVSIGGYGIPIAQAADGTMTFESDFTFDHLAIVHKPAYERADINKVERLEASKEFIYQTDTNENQAKEANIMSDEIDYVAEIEDLKSQLVLANAIIDENEAKEAAAAEEARLELVKKASDLGLKGHEDLSSETITNLIASWESSRPSEEVVMAEATPAPDNMVSEVVEASSTTNVVANYLNGEMVTTDSNIYARVWNSIAASYNTGNFTINGDGNAYTFEEAVDKGFLKITQRGE
tara:strand:+ start:3606 stop:5021 length:1416 start_codon:yes stop_codon:yes gene_type:complete